MPELLAVVADLDGTLVESGRRVSPATVRAVGDLKARGTPLIIATARTPTWVAALKPLLPAVTVAVCCGGAIGWSPRAGAVHWRDIIPSGDVERIVRSTARHLPDAGIAAYDGECWRVTQAFDAVGPTRLGPRTIVAAEQITDGTVCTMSISRPAGIEERFRALLPANVSVCWSATGDVVDLAPPGTDKATGVARALAAVGVEPVRAIAYGDMLNDLSMFALCGSSIAVANAHPDLIAAATGVTACVHDDGVARSLGDLDLADDYPKGSRTAPLCACPTVEDVRCLRARWGGGEAQGDLM